MRPALPPRSLLNLAGLALAALAMLGGCAAEEPERKRPPPIVSASPVKQHLFVEQLEAVGTARANEQVTIAAIVTERIERVLFGDSQAVARGQVLAVLSQRQEVASLEGAVASEQQANAQYNRIKTLHERGFATQALLDQNLAAAARARADAAEARAAIADRVIRAPFSGYTGLRTISAGAVVQAGTPLVTVSDISRIKLDFTVPETQLARLRVGTPIEAAASAFAGEVFRGTISSIDPVIDPATRAVMVRAVLPNPAARLKPGMLLAVKLLLAERTADAVPELAVIGNGAVRSVFVLGADNKAKSVTVQTGLRDAGLIEVTGLPAGARVITEGALKVTDGMKVRLPGPPKRAGAKGKKPAGAAAAP